MQLPPCGTHVWRQCNTLAMSRNFAEEDMDILHPRIDRRNETNGITGSGFPLFEWLLALCSKIFGHVFLLNRIFSLLISTLAILALYHLLMSLGIARNMAAAGALLLLSIPEFYYHSINALPDIMALAAALGALYYGLQLSKELGQRSFFLFFVLSAIAGLIKFQFLIIPFAGIAAFDFKNKKTIYFISLCTAVLSVVTAWYFYALRLTESNNLREFGLWIKPVTRQEKFQTLAGNLTMDLPEVLMGWPLFIALMILLIVCFRQLRMGRNAWILLLWLLGFAAFYFAAIERMQHHSYYFMPMLPFFIIVFLLLFKKKNLSIKLLYAVLGLNTAWAMVRIIPSRWVEGKYNIPAEFSNHATLAEFSHYLPPNSKVVIGPDISGCIYFYFTHTKGYSFERAEELITIKQNQPDIENMRAAGIRYLIIRDGSVLSPMAETLHLKRKVATIGQFEIWEL